MKTAKFSWQELQQFIDDYLSDRGYMSPSESQNLSDSLYNQQVEILNLQMQVVRQEFMLKRLTHLIAQMANGTEFKATMENGAITFEPQTPPAGSVAVLPVKVPTNDKAA